MTEITPLLLLDTTPTIQTPPAELRVLSHVGVLNRDASVVYLQISEQGQALNPSIPIGASAHVTLAIGKMFQVASFTASTAANGTGDPTTDLEVSPVWDVI